MIRRAAAVAVALCLNPAWLYAQTPVLTVNSTTADVHLSPSTGSPVIGHAAKGTVLAVTRELGSWVRVSWPAAKDGAGYVHLSVGLLGNGSPSEPNRPAASTTAVAMPAPPTVVAPVAISAERTSPVEPAAPASSVYVTPATHRLGLGGRVGNSTLGVGASARAWSPTRLGLQFEVSRYALDNIDATERVTSIRFEPSLLYTLPDHVTDFVWTRPYLGSGINIRRQTSSATIPGDTPSVSENKLGFQVFGGAELTFAGVPPFALSVDLAHHWAKTSFTGIDFGGFGMSVAGHWYVK